MSGSPEPDEVEVSIFGPGFGECVLLHIGCGKWIVVDCCIDEGSKESLPLNYLKQIGVDPSEAVVQIVATHWHDDHVRGISRAVEECRRAEFVCSVAMTSEEFVTLATAYGKRAMMDSSGVSEFFKTLQILKERSLKGGCKVPALKYAVADRCICKGTHALADGELKYAVYALSPTDVATTLAKYRIAQMLPREGQPKRRMPSLEPNHAAVALWVEIGNATILLGSDLQEDGHPGTGWSAIVSSLARPPGKAEVFKIAHHGSENGHLAAVWDQMLGSDPFSGVTPFTLGGMRLPTQRDVLRILNQTRRAFISSAFDAQRPSKRSRVVERQIKQVVKNRRRLNSAVGQIRFRKRMRQDNQWKTELTGGAMPLEKSLFLN